MLIEHEGRRPRVAESSYVALTTVLCGDVWLGADNRILFWAVLTERDRADRMGGCA
jgi:gamma-carbonic anhydrase